MKYTQDHNHQGSDDEPLKHNKFEILNFSKLLIQIFNNKKRNQFRKLTTTFKWRSNKMLNFGFSSMQHFKVLK